MPLASSYSTAHWDATFPLKVFKQSADKPIPLRRGDTLPSLTFEAIQSIWQHLPAQLTPQLPISARQLVTKQPLVLTFLSSGWNQYGLNHLQALRAAYPEILALGGNLLAIVQGTYQQTIGLINDFDVSYNLVADDSNLIAQQLGLYAPLYPVWERVSGVSEDVPLPAVYVIAPNGKIIYDSVDTDFSTPFSITEMLVGVFNAGRFFTK
ncbi:MAG: redoxin domain-containing protein [Spirosomataceae bacterium]